MFTVTCLYSAGSLVLENLHDQNRKILLKVYLGKASCASSHTQLLLVIVRIGVCT